MAILYIATQLLGALWFSMQVAGFHARPFLLAMVPNLFAATFATALAAACAAWVRRRVAAALVALGITTTLVGMALVGYYQPAWRAWANLNPIAVGASALGRLDHLDVLGTLVPAGTLVLATAAMLWLGSIGARRLAVLS
jgi:ABC-2 type transport system permease protein